MKRIEVAGICLVLATSCPAFSVAAVTRSRGPDPKVLATQVLLDRLGFGPGVIDGRAGGSFTKAIRGFQESRGLDVTGNLDPPTA